MLTIPSRVKLNMGLHPCKARTSSQTVQPSSATYQSRMTPRASSAPSVVIKQPLPPFQVRLMSTFANFFDRFPPPKAMVPRLSVDELAALMASDKVAGRDYVVVDVRRTDLEV